MDQSESQPRRRRRAFLSLGESFIGSIGITTASILLATVALSGWWANRSQQQAWQSTRAEQVRVVGDLLRLSAEAMIASNDLSALRRLVVEASQTHQLQKCELSLPDGHIIAAADPSQINLVTLPPSWPSGPLDAGLQSASTDTPQLIALTLPLIVSGRGPAILSLVADTSPSVSRLWETTSVIGLVGAAGLAALLLLYRRVRSRVASLALIRDALLASQSGVATTQALQLKADLGPEADAWNQLLTENETLRQASLAERVKDSLGESNRDAGDLENACDALTVGMIVVDQKLKVKHANGAAGVLLQTRRDAMIGQDISSIIADASANEALAAIIGGSGHRRTLEIRRTDAGDGILRLQVRPLRREDAAGALVTIEDITQQRVAEASRNSFVAHATHELRTPLTNMRLCLEAALDGDSGNAEKLREHLNMLSHEARRLERMVGEMLSVSEIEAGSLRLKRDDVRLDRVFAELQADYQPQAQDKKITLAFELPPKFPVIHADRDKLMVALHNLLGNALKYTHDGGRVTVAVRDESGKLIVDVTDTGIGINPDQHEKIFDKFYRANDERVAAIAGTGLGLALARDIARLHGGEVSLQSELNNGSTFTLTVPTVTPIASQAA